MNELYKESKKQYLTQGNLLKGSYKIRGAVHTIAAFQIAFFILLDLSLYLVPDRFESIVEFVNITFSVIAIPQAYGSLMCTSPDIFRI